MNNEVKAFSSCGGLMANMTWGSNTPTLAITHDVYGLNDLFVSSYLICAGTSPQDANGQSDYIAMDSGNNPETLIEALDRHQINPDQVKAVFLTHAHGDHTGGLGVYTDARIYISQAEKDFVLHQKCDEVDLMPEEFSQFECLQSGDIIRLNDTTVEVITSPGHTPGSVSYLVNGKYLFAGATLNIDANQKAEHQMCTLNEDHDLLKKSNQKLARIVADNGIEMVFTTHGGYTAQPRLAFSDWL